MDEECCPICIEPFDDQDRLFLPCACQYQVCMFCVRRILTEFDGRCPGCRSDYREENFRFRQLEADEVVRSRRQKAEKARQAEREKAKLAQQAKQQQQQQQSTQAAQQPAKSRGGQRKSPTSTPYTGPPPAPLLDIARASRQVSGPNSGGAVAAALTNGHDEERSLLQQQLYAAESLALQRKHLINVRVWQRHVLFLTGLPSSLSREDALRRRVAAFGQVSKLTLNRPSRNVVTAHVVYSKPEEARAAVLGLEGQIVDGQMVRAAIGSNKYCPAFLRGQQCGISDCSYLHAIQENALTGHKDDRAFLDGQDDDFSPEHLGGIDMAAFERLRGGVPARPATMSKAPGDGVARPSNAASDSSGFATCSPISLAVSFILRRAYAVHPDVKSALSVLCAPRHTSQAFAGLSSLLSTPYPIFISPPQQEGQ